ncbi:MAG: hypothetical protein R3C53_07575 [Pirellulaceae bacterium]
MNQTPSNPYSPLSSPPELEPGKRPLPNVVKWQMLYCAAMLVLYLACTVGASILWINAQAWAADADELREMQIMGAVGAIFCLPLAALFAAGMIWHRGNFGWILNIVLICIGLTSACCMPAAIPLLIFWLKHREDIVQG